MAKKQSKTKVFSLPNTTLYERRYEGVTKASYFVYFNHPEKKYCQVGLHTSKIEDATEKAKQVEAALLVGTPLSQIKEMVSSRSKSNENQSSESKSVNRPTIGEVIDKFSNTYRNWSKETHYRNRRKLSDLICAVGGSSAIAAEINKTDVIELLDKKEQAGMTSYNRYLAAYRTLFKWAIERSYMDTNPVEALSLKRVSQAIPEALADNEIKALLAELSPYNKHVALLLLHTGMRWGEASSLLWENVDWKNRVIKLPITKSKTFRSIPINNTALSALTWLRDVTDDQVHTINKNIKSSFLDRSKVILCKDIKKGLAQASKRAGIKHVHAHMLRHTFATNLFEKTGNLNILMNVLGHSTPQMSLRYAKLRGVGYEALDQLEGYTEE